MFKTIKQTVDARYPLPVSGVFRKYHALERSDVVARQKVLSEVLECLLKFACVVCLQEARRCCTNLRERLTLAKFNLDALRQPSVGTWEKLLFTLCSIEQKWPTPPYWIPRVRAWYFAGKDQSSAAAIAQLKAADVVRFNSTSRPNQDLANALINYRNKMIGHGAYHGRGLPDELTAIEAALTHLLRSAEPLLGGMSVFYVQRQEVVADDRRHVFARSLDGNVGEEAVDFVLNEQLALSEIYVDARETGEVSPLPLGPMLLYLAEPDGSPPDVYFYNGAMRTQLDYLSYASGRHHYPRDLRGGFDGLIDLQLRTASGEAAAVDPGRLMSPETRVEWADALAKKSLAYQAAGQLEDAADCLEQAITYDRRAEYFFMLADLQLQLGEGPQRAAYTLRTGLEIDPTDASAVARLAQLEDRSNGDAIPQPSSEAPGITRVADAPKADSRGSDEDDDDGSAPIAAIPPQMTAASPALRFPTLLERIVPRRIRRFGMLVWLTAIVAWYSASIVAEATIGHRRWVVALALHLACCVSIIAALPVLRAWLLRLRAPLSQQLAKTSSRQFETWFEARLGEIFGAGGNGTSLMRPAWEPLHTIAVLVWIIIGTAAGAFFSQALSSPAGLGDGPAVGFAVKRIVDYALLALVLCPAVRYTVGLTWFVYTFSRRALKPLLTRIADDGLRAFSPFVTFNICYATFVFGVLHAAFAAAYSHPFRGDLLFFVLGTSILATWTVALPLQLRIAIRAARSKPVFDYSLKLQQAFADFVNDPEEDRERRLLWLLDRQSVFRRLPGWPLSFWQTMVSVVGCNLLLAAVVAAYVITRMHWWGMLWKQVKGW